MNLICFIAPFIALIAIALAIFVSPNFNWYDNALSDLGHYTRTDIGSNPFLRAIIFNLGLIITGLLMLYYLKSLYNRVRDTGTRIGLFPFVIACIFLISIGIFSENIKPIHFYVSVGFFFSFPLSMWIMGILWFRNPKLKWFAAISFFIPLISLYLWWGTTVERFVWSGVAIPEILTAITAIGWIWVVNIFDIKYDLVKLIK